ncbi:hypothetical protein L6164_002122 [Bauhinia variegata]|uniref:Uncharacterized protein n=1 Tax=Bauhinia variegata TaxID=167791 RepID=A0ACB9PX23_BAUVA|nr:hypothetical protein L6164_002122 [Bauhinia variegata]
MASIPALFLLSLVLFANELQAQTNNSKIISLGSSLSPKTNPSSWVSASGHFAFGFYPQGNGFAIGIWLVGKPENTIVWTANRDRPPVSSDSSLELTSNGELVLQTEQDNELIANASSSAASASMLDSGNFVLYGKDFNVIWETFDYPTDTILGGQNLSAGAQLVSSRSESDHSSGGFVLKMQKDGNLVPYPVNSSANRLGEDAYWASRTDGSYFDKLTLNLEGYLRLYSTSNDTYHVFVNGTIAAKNTTIVYRATLERDGNFRLYEHNIAANTSPEEQIVWSILSNPCDVKGICGFNSFCSNQSHNAVCQCFTGFVPSNDSNMFLECKRNSSRDECLTRPDPTMFYDVLPLENIWWGDNPYSFISMKKEACGKSCLDDCDCGGVLYKEGKCNKYKLPLRYGKQTQQGPATALIKVAFQNSSIPPNGPIDNKTSLVFILVVILGSISFLFLVFTMFVFFGYRNQVHSYRKLCANDNLGFTKECSLRSFSFDELVNYTSGFTQEVGRGSFGAVYEGTITENNRRIAVKKLDRVVEEGERKFQAEIAAIARTHHRNLVQLIGFCSSGSRKLLVYEFVSNGSLADLLFNTEKCLSWKERLRIAQEVARGILYLHEECEICIIHCNIKPQNILIDEAWTPKICDFGLARLWMQKYSGTTRIGLQGTSGYVSPEWLKDETVSVKVDIYSYGMLLLEIICRRRSIDLNLSSEEIFLPNWVYGHFLAGELNRLVIGDEEVDWRILERMVKIGLWCVQEDPSLRPPMKHVILMLEGLQHIPAPPSTFHRF